MTTWSQKTPENEATPPITKGDIFFAFMPRLVSRRMLQKNKGNLGITENWSVYPQEKQNKTGNLAKSWIEFKKARIGSYNHG